MGFLTDRKRAVGLGSAKEGTEHHWSMTISSVGLIVLVPLFIFTFGRILGREHAEVVAYFAQPFPAIVAALTLVVGLVHFKNGAQVLLEDYSHGLTRKYLIIGTTCLSYALIATGLFGLVKLAL